MLSDKSQAERDSVLSEFRSGRCLVLVATDVAARGLDVKDIRVVVNYDFPTWVEDYVHRIGRTGRAGVTSIAYTIFCDNDAKYGSDLVKILEGANQTVSHGHLLMIPMVARDPLVARLEIVQSSAYNSSSGSQYSGNPSFNARYDTTFSGPSVLDEPSLTSSFRTAVTTTRPVAFEASLPD